MWQSRSRAVRHFARAAGFCLVFAAACGSSEASSDPAAKFLARYAQIWCPRLTPCCTASGAENDVATCVAVNSSVEASAQAERHLNQAQAEACLAALQNWNCDELQPDACHQVFAGPVPPGGACTNSAFDCAPAKDGFASCRHQGGEDTCKVTPDPAPGQPCGKAADTPSEHFECTRDAALYCDAASQTCQPRLDAGEPCNSDAECLRGLSCDSAKQRCVARSPVGNDCTSSACIETAYCDPSSHACAAKKLPGSVCTTDAECMTACDATAHACIATLYSCFPKK